MRKRSGGPRRRLTRASAKLRLCDPILIWTPSDRFPNSRRFWRSLPRAGPNQLQYDLPDRVIGNAAYQPLHMTITQIILAALLLFLVLVFLRKHLLGPFWLHGRHVTPRVFVYEEISEEQARVLLPPLFFETFAELKGLGFALVSHLLHTQFTKSRTAVTLFVNDETKTMALVGRIVITLPGAKRAPRTFVNFFTHLKDGIEVDTINSLGVQ